ncbi:MAG: hypothetical protein CM1200mP2_47930 [Planctomycetaceae bacterium]|nr:MAG: hypothetical protein CM1200mP2_47930 [Planctomycetaceae bacterium]
MAVSTSDVLHRSYGRSRCVPVGNDDLVDAVVVDVPESQAPMVHEGLVRHRRRGFRVAQGKDSLSDRQRLPSRCSQMGCCWLRRSIEGWPLGRTTPKCAISENLSAPRKVVVFQVPDPGVSRSGRALLVEAPLTTSW